MSRFEKLKLWREGQIYILPNQFGYLFVLLFFVILLTGATYSSNIVYLLAFIHLSFSIVIMVLTQKNLKHVELKLVKAEDSFCNEIAPLIFVTDDNGKNKAFNIVLSIPEWNWKSDITTANSKIHRHFINFSTRGKKKASFVKISSTYPYGLFYAWKYKKVNIELFVYPARKGGKNLDLLINNHLTGEDFYSHREYSVGDNYKHIDWKSFAKHSELLVKEFKDEKAQPILFRLSQVKNSDFEKKLEQLSTWVDIVSHKDIDFGIDFPNKYISASKGESHKKLVLRELACYQETT